MRGKKVGMEGAVRVSGPMNTPGQSELTPVEPSITTYSAGGMLRGRVMVFQATGHRHGHPVLHHSSRGVCVAVHSMCLQLRSEKQKLGAPSCHEATAWEMIRKQAGSGRFPCNTCYEQHHSVST